MRSGNWTAEDCFIKAKIYESNNELDNAIYFYNEAIFIDSSMTEAYSSRANLYFLQGEYDRALSDFEYLLSLDKRNTYLAQRAFCKEKLGEFEVSLHLYLERLLADVDVDAYNNIYRIVRNFPEFQNQINFSEINELISKYVDEDRALKFKNAASEFDLDQRNDFLDLHISLLPKNSKYLYDAYVLKAQAEIFRYKLCFDKIFREDLKQTESLTEDELNAKYTYNANLISELNMVYAVQKFNEATRYAKNLFEVNYLDNEVAKIMKLADYEL